MSIYADLGNFDLGGMARLVAALRDSSTHADSARDFAQRVCALLHASFVGHDGQPQTALVRLYGTTNARELPERLRDGLADGTKCLALLGSAGTEPAWNDPEQSVAHRVLPLIDAEQVAQLPMVAALLEQLGVDIPALTANLDEVILPVTDERGRVFYVPDAADSPVIPDQDFVRTHGIVSAIGFGGPIIGGEVFAVVLFSKVRISREAASLCETLALSIGLAALDLAQAPLLRADGAARRTGLAERDVLKAQVELSTALVRAHERVSKLEADRAVFAQAQAEYDSRRTAALAAVAMRLSNVQEVAEIPDLLVSEGLHVLGAQGVSIALVDATGQAVDVSISSGFGPEAAVTYASLPLDDALPTTWSARTGEVCLLPDTEGEHAFPAMREVGRDVGVRAVAVLPLVVSEQLIGALTCTWQAPHAFDASGLEVMQALAAQVAQSADRTRLLEREREHSTALQRSLLSEPPDVAGCEVQVRYQPAAEVMQVGGDWYDVVPQSDGATMLVVGDVMGHDSVAAAAMAQLRGLMRGLAWSGGGPCDVLTQADGAIDGLALGVTATALLARLEPDALLCWSSAGHPPLMLLRPDGTVHELVADEADLLLGVDRDTKRNEHALPLSPGMTLLLYTDGLIERRGEGLDTGLARLRSVLTSLTGLPLPELCDQLLERMRDGADDDIALLALRYTG